MGILDSIVEWIATQVMNLLDLITGSVLGALGCDMSTFLRYFPAAETLYEIFVAIGVGFILLNLVWQLFRNFGLGLGLSAEDPVKLAIKSILFIFLALFADQIMVLVLGIVGTPYDWVVDTALPPIEFASFASVVTVLVGSLVSGSVSLIVLILVLIVAWNYMSNRSYGQILARLRQEGLAYFSPDGQFLATSRYSLDHGKTQEAIMAFWAFIQMRDHVLDFCASEPPAILSFSSADKDYDLISGSQRNIPSINASRTLVPEASVRLIVVDDMKSLDELIPRDDNDYGVLTGSDGVEQIYKL